MNFTTEDIPDEIKEIAVNIGSYINTRVERAVEDAEVGKDRMKNLIDAIDRDIDDSKEALEEYDAEQLTALKAEHEGYLRGLMYIKSTIEKYYL